MKNKNSFFKIGAVSVSGLLIMILYLCFPISADDVQKLEVSETSKQTEITTLITSATTPVTSSEITTELTTTPEITTTTEVTTTENIYKDYNFSVSLNDVNNLKSQNDDVQGWIYIPGTPIDYPVLRYTDNDHYLSYDEYNQPSGEGSIYMDFRCDFDAAADPRKCRNVIIYGHNMANGSMFNNLLEFVDESYYHERTLIEICTTKEQRLYEIYAVCNIFGLRTTNFKYWDEEYINNMGDRNYAIYNTSIKNSRYFETGVWSNFGEDLLTLQTCNGSDGWRIVVFAHRVL